MGLIEARRHPESTLVPKIVIDPSLSDPEVPYTVTVDAEGCGRFLQTYGMRDRKIRARTLDLRRLPVFTERALGERLGRRIILACDPIWRTMNVRDDVSLPSSVFHHEARHAIDASHHLTNAINKVTLFWYPIPGLIGAGIFAKTVDAPLTTDIGTTIVFALASTLGIGVAIEDTFPNYFYDHRRSRPERRAYRFQEEVRNDPRWQNLVTLTAKVPQESLENLPQLDV